MRIWIRVAIVIALVFKKTIKITNHMMAFDQILKLKNAVISKKFNKWILHRVRYLDVLFFKIALKWWYTPSNYAKC